MLGELSLQVTQVLMDFSQSSGHPNLIFLSQSPFEGVLNPCHLASQLIAGRDGVQQGLDERAGQGLMDILRQIAYPYPFGNSKISAVLRDLSREKSQEGGLSYSIWANESDAVAWLNLEIHLAEKFSPGNGIG
jgi:hypothetical protein